MSEKNSKPDQKAFVVTKSGDKRFTNETGATWKNSKCRYSIKLKAVAVNGETRCSSPMQNTRLKAGVF